MCSPLPPSLPPACAAPDAEVDSLVHTRSVGGGVGHKSVGVTSSRRLSFGEGPFRLRSTSSRAARDLLKRSMSTSWIWPTARRGKWNTRSGLLIGLDSCPIHYMQGWRPGPSKQSRLGGLLRSSFTLTQPYRSVSVRAHEIKLLLVAARGQIEVEIRRCGLSFPQQPCSLCEPVPSLSALQPANPHISHPIGAQRAVRPRRMIAMRVRKAKPRLSGGMDPGNRVSLDPRDFETLRTSSFHMRARFCQSPDMRPREAL